MAGGKWLGRIASAAVLAWIGLSGIVATHAAPICFSVNGVDSSGGCSVTPLAVGATSPSLNVMFDTTLADGDTYQILGTPGSSNPNGVNFGAGTPFSIQYLGNSTGSASQADTLTASVLRAYTSNVTSVGVTALQAVHFSPTIAPASTAQTTVSLNGTQVAAFGPFSSSNGTAFSQVQSYSLGISTGTLSQSNTYTSTFKAGSPVGSYVTYGTAPAPTLPSIISPQVVYLDFGLDPNAKIAVDSNSLFITETNYIKPDSGLTQSQINAVTSEIQEIYGSYNISFVTTKPTSSVYDTIYIGGSKSDLPSYVQLTIGNTNYLGLSRNFNINNSNPTDSAVVFSSNAAFAFPDSSADGCTDSTVGTICLGLLSQVIAHETGHLLGLYHVTNTQDLMYPIADENSVFLGGPNTIASGAYDNLGQALPLASGITQDDNAVLSCEIGLSSIMQRYCGVGSTVPYLDVIVPAASISRPIYDAELVTNSDISDSDGGHPTYYLGTVLPLESENIELPIGFSTADLYGASIEGGPLQDVENNIVTEVPEPNTIEIFMIGLCGLYFVKNGSFFRLLRFS